MNIVEEFKKIRDIPYRIPLSPGESDDCCSGKSVRLFNLLRDASYNVRYRVCSFRWSDMKLPTKVQDIPHEGESTHSYLEVKIRNEWIAVDATWDKGLKDVFEINEWDGKSNTKVAVPVRECFTLDKSAEYMKESNSSEAILDDLRKNGRFYGAFNNWLAEIRIKSPRDSQ